jgi:hypothetical protein
VGGVIKPRMTRFAHLLTITNEDQSSNIYFIIIIARDEKPK